MENKRNNQLSLFLLAALSALLFQVIYAENFEDQKNYYSPDPHAGTPPTGHSTPTPSHGGGHSTPTPSHGGGYTTPTPSHGGGHATPAPSHGGGTHRPTPPVNCGNPPSGGHHTTPSPPRRRSSNPPSGGGTYYRPPPSSTPTTPTPTTPTPTTPTPTTPSPPTIGTPPFTPIVDPGTPSTPGYTIPSPPFSFDPNSPPFTCTYWRNHPTLIWGLFGFWGTTLGSAFGVPSLPGSSTNLLEALSNTRTDGFGNLYREGTAALLNSMMHVRFPYTTNQVRDSFVGALDSNNAAAAQAELFKRANEGRTSHKA